MKMIYRKFSFGVFISSSFFFKSNGTDADVNGTEISDKVETNGISDVKDEEKEEKAAQEQKEEDLSG